MKIIEFSLISFQNDIRDITHETIRNEIEKYFYKKIKYEETHVFNNDSVIISTYKRNGEFHRWFYPAVLHGCDQTYWLFGFLYLEVIARVCWVLILMWGILHAWKIL